MDSSLFFVRVFVVDLIHALRKGQFNVVSLGLNGFGVRFLPSSNPEVLAVAIAIVNGQRRESRGFGAVEDGFVIFVFRKDLTDS